MSTNEPAPNPATKTLEKTFGDLVRDALLHLYDAAYLQTHPLARQPGFEPTPDATLRGKRLLQALLDAIEALRPAAGTSTESRAWRSYRLLELRYIEGLSVVEVMDQLAIQKTQYQRDHARALEAVASLLRDRWQIKETPDGQADDVESRQSLAVTEAAQLTSQVAPEYLDLRQIVSDLIALLRPASLESQVTLSLRGSPHLPTIYGDRVTLRQVFLGLLSLGIERATNGTVDVTIAAVDQNLVTTIDASSGASSGGSDEESMIKTAPELEVARELASTLGGKVEVSDGQPEHWQARISLPVADRPIVLVLDNHPDFVSLVSRYLAEHQWRVVGAQDVQQAQALAAELLPTVILLDVMLPGQDGWELLVSLKAHPKTHDIPVIVCSILYEPRVARSLGAVGYLPKPFSQAALLEALAPWRQCTPGAEPGC